MKKHWPLILAVLPGIGRRVSETKSSFRVGQRTAERVLWLFFGTFLLILGVGGGMGWALGCNFMLSKPLFKEEIFCNFLAQ